MVKWLGLAIALACAIVATGVRLAQLDTWSAHPDVYYPGGTPVATTLDAYYVLRWARASLDGSWQPEADDALRRHQTLQRPRGASDYRPGDGELDWRERREPKRLPGLSQVLAALAPLAGSVERAGLLLVPIAGSLFLVPLFLVGLRLGHPAAALMAGAVASFSNAYYERTSPGWTDTDCLNLFFPWTASLLVMCMARGQRRATTLLLSAVLGLTLYAYFWWYERPALAYLFWATMALHLALQRVPVGFAAACVAICVLFSHPLQLALGAGNLATWIARYVLESNPTAAFSIASAWFPDVMRTVGEARHGSLREALGAVLASPATVAIGIAAVVPAAAMRWRQFVPLLPLAGLAALGLLRGPRFAMYLAPLAGFGLGLLVEWAISGWRSRARADVPATDPRGEKLPMDLTAETAATAAAPASSAAAARRRLPFGAVRDAFDAARLDARGTLVAYAAVVVVFVVAIRPMTAIGFVGQPAVPAPVVTALRELSRTLPPDAALWTWWDDGYAIEDLARRAAYHDGGGQFTPQTSLIAYSLVVDDPAALVNTIRFVDREGNRGIDRVAREAGSREKLLARVAGGEAEPVGTPVPARPVVLFFSATMTTYFSTMRHAAGLPTHDARGDRLAYEPLPCRSMRGPTLACERFEVDLTNGRFTDGRTVDALVVIDGGKPARTTRFEPTSGAVLVFVVGASGRTEVLRVPQEVYRSNFNRMFLLGEFDPTRFEETYRRDPAVRAFKVLR